MGIVERKEGRKELIVAVSALGHFRFCFAASFSVCLLTYLLILLVYVWLRLCPQAIAAHLHLLS